MHPSNWRSYWLTSCRISKSCRTFWFQLYWPHWYWNLISCIISCHLWTPFDLEKQVNRFISVYPCSLPENLIVSVHFSFFQGFISSYNQDEILDSLDSIEDDIAKGRFEWRANKDVRSNIVETLVERVGEPARKLNATISQYVQKQTILRLWFHDSADKIVTQIENLQVYLFLERCFFEFLFPALLLISFFFDARHIFYVHFFATDMK